MWRTQRLPGFNASLVWLGDVKESALLRHADDVVVLLCLRVKRGAVRANAV
jgi:hypothetical protein